MKKNSSSEVIATCVQCHRELEYSVDDESIKFRIFVCTNPDCANYGLLCISQEKMPE